MSSPSELLVVETVADVRRAVADARRQGKTVGVVPTMGALHAGHVSLMDAARQRCGFVAATIFVNPTQFGPHEDFQKYPRPRDADLALCRQAGVDLVFYPTRERMYPAGFSTFVEVEGLSRVLEGAVRPGHFRGVATIVLKLFNIVQPDAAFFGQKDYQQQTLIRQMVRDLDVPVEIVTCPTVREPDGLAMSSRNAYLSAEERRSALALWRALQAARDELTSGERDIERVRQTMVNTLRATPGVTVDYATVADPETLEVLAQPHPRMVLLVAARVGQTRLIDNLLVQLDKD